MEFEQLAQLKRDIATLREYHTVSLSHYLVEDFCGFRHKFESPQEKERKFSKTSTATCVLSLISANQWSGGAWSEQTALLISEMLDTKNWQGAGLPLRNPFTVAFMLEAVNSLAKVADSSALNNKEPQIKQAEEILHKALMKKNVYGVRGAAQLAPYPPTTYLTQLVVRVLQTRNKFSDDARVATKDWAWRQIDHELALRYCGSPSADAYALAYAIILVSLCVKPYEATPEQNLIRQKGIDAVFDSQLPDGSWPRSRPLFHYPEVGNAYCYEYEMLVQLLQYKDLTEHILRHVPELSLATRRLKEIAFPLGNGGIGWASGHHPQLAGPESWSTASVFHFLYELDRFLPEPIRRSVFDYIGAEYIAPGEPQHESEFAINFLDSDIHIGEDTGSLRELVFDGFVSPLARHAQIIEQGGNLPSYVPISAVFFGPPGTAKTSLAKAIANFLGWPLLTIDPSHLVRKGLDQVQAETNTVFTMLATLERVVVLLDEFDEMVRERTAEQSEVISRFLTTAMLPKLALINERRRIVFIVATNHIDQFDFAIRRPGRFDIIAQIMPPNLEAKLDTWQNVRDILKKFKLNTKKGSEIEKKLSELTFAEFDQLSKQLQTAENGDQVKRFIERTHAYCTLIQIVHRENGKTWAVICDEQRKYVRVPHYRGIN